MRSPLSTMNREEKFDIKMTTQFIEESKHGYFLILDVSGHGTLGKDAKV